MAWRDWLPWLRERQSTADYMLSSHAVPPSPGRAVAAKEFGVSGTENFGGEIRHEDANPDFDSIEKSVVIFDKMRRTDAQIRAMLQVIKLPLRGATWQCEPATADPVDKEIADFCNNALFDDDSMQDSWDYVLRHILLQLDFGFSVLEKVWMVDRHGYYRFKRLAPRLPRTIREFHTDRDGSLLAVVQYAPVAKSVKRYDSGGQSLQYNTSVSYQYLTIPAEYAAVFTLDREGDNYAGMSALRPVYRNWWFKDSAYRTIAIGLDRWGVGIPMGKLAENHSLTAGDLETLRKTLQAMRVNEKSYLMAPPGVDFDILPKGGGQGTIGQFGIEWIDHNDSQIARNVLAGFLTMGRDTKGTLGFGSRLTDMFISSLNGMAQGIASDLKRQIIKPLCDMNFDMTERKYPTPVCLDLEQVELSNLLDSIAKLSGTVLTAQDDDESTLRKLLGLPKLDPKNSRDHARKAGAAQAGAAPGAPGQPPPPGGGNPQDVADKETSAAS